RLRTRTAAASRSGGSRAWSSSSRVPESRSDSGDRAHQRPADLLAAARAPAAQQLDLELVHRVDVRVAQLDRAAEHRVPVEQLLLVDDLEHGRDRALVLLDDRTEQAVVLDEREVVGRDVEARLRESH